MHPELWTVPGINFAIRSYGFTIVVGFALAVWISVRRARRFGLDASAITTISLLGAVMGAAGCRLMYILHHELDAFRAGEIPLTELLNPAGGREVLGGVVLGMLSVLVFLKATRRPVLRYLDVCVPSLILAMGIGRIGCLLFGCCWGGICETDTNRPALAWAIQFPYGSPAYIRQATNGEIDVPPELMWRLPGSETREPVPDELLIQRYAAHDAAMEEYAVKRALLAAQTRAGEPEPTLDVTRNELRDLQRRLPGDKAQDKVMFVALATHLAVVNSNRDGTPLGMSDLRAIASQQQTRWIHPTQVYDFLSLTLMFVVLSAVLLRTNKPGLTLATAMVLYAISRFTMESLRADNPRDTAGLTISQFISVCVMLVGAGLFVYAMRRREDASATAAPQPT